MYTYNHTNTINCVGVMLVNNDNLVFTGKRYGVYSWQMPQGSIEYGELPWDAANRELCEEVSLAPVELLATHTKWMQHKSKSNKIQRQKWFLCRFLGRDEEITVAMSNKPEFENWRWSEMKEIPNNVIQIKRDIYVEVIREFESMFKAYI